MTAAPIDSDLRDMPKAYDPAPVEQRIYAWWEESGFFRPSGSGRPFTIIQPPPNLTGELHLGHALTVAIEDLLIRWHRMRGDDTLWLPGVDHAALAVNALVERELGDEGLTRLEIGRPAFLERAWDFVARSRSRIAAQHRRLGASADWERERFTMDPGSQRAVRHTFKRLCDDGLIYRGEYIVNWCPECRSAVSDLEVEHADVDGFFWHVRYPVLDKSGNKSPEAVVIATTRPETIPADTAIAVHPDDERYRHLVGRRVLVPTTERAVEVIADELVDPEAGSGALKVTPGHDPVDFEIGQRHGLEVRSIIDPDGTLNELAGPYAGYDRLAARERVVADLERDGLLDRVEPHTHAIGHCERSGTVVEPLVSEQWFVRTAPLAARAIEAVRDGRISFVPKRFERVYLQWMENIRDWCISRQIWWGSRIPVWHCEGCQGMTVSIEDATRCEHCGGEQLSQDEDTLDTWFSSGLWPHSALGWPEDTPDLERYYPTQVMETGYDIIFFWVARMIMLSLYNMDGAIPFETVYLHGLVRAPDGSKMSKSKGNSVDPLEQVERYGCDALRFALVSAATPGTDQRITEQRLEDARNFTNKIWNASRFALSLVRPDELRVPPAGAAIPLEDRWILSRCAGLIRAQDELLQSLELAEAARRLRTFFWDEFADWYIEIAKIRVREGDRSAVPVLLHVLDRVLRLLHPFMPFATEEIWQRLRAVYPPAADAPALIVAPYPEADAARIDPTAEAELAALQDFVRSIRHIRSEKRVEAGRWIEVWLVAGPVAEAARAARPALEALARARPLHIVETLEEAPTDGVATQVLPHGRVCVPLAGLFDAEQERARLHKQLAALEESVARLESKLANPNFVNRAPAPVVAKDRKRLAAEESQLAGLRERLNDLV